MKLPILLLFLSCFACNALTNSSQYNRVDCGDTVGDDYFLVLDSKQKRLPPEDFQILVRGDRSSLIKSVSSTSKGCFSKQALDRNDTVLVKSSSRNEAQIVRPEMIQGRTQIILQPLADRKPNISCNHNLLDSTLVLNQFINLNDARFLEFYNISAVISLDQKTVDTTDTRPLLNAGNYDLKNLIRGKTYGVDLRLHDYVFSNGSQVETNCELDMDIPSLSAKLGDEIKEFRNYFGARYGVVDQGYELNFYIEGGLKTVAIDYCLLRIDPENRPTIADDASCTDLGLPIQSYGASEKGERFTEGFWQVFYRYKKGLLVKPWTSQRLMVRKVCDAALYKTEDFDQSFCTDISGNINAEGLDFKGHIQIKYASVLLGQLYLYGTAYQSVSLPNLQFASQIDIQYNYELSRIHLPQLKEVSLNFTLAENPLPDLEGLHSLERVGGILNLYNAKIQNLTGLEQLRVVGGSLLLVNNSLLSDVNQLKSLTTVGGEFSLDSNPLLNTITGFKSLSFVKSINLNNNMALEEFSLQYGIHVHDQVVIANNPKLHKLSGFEGIQSLNILGINNNDKLDSFDAFENIRTLNSLTVSGNPMIVDFKPFKKLQSIKLSFLCENMQGLQSFDGLQNINNLDSLNILNNGLLRNFYGLNNLQSLTTFSVEANAQMESFEHLDSLSKIINRLVIRDNPNLETLSGPTLNFKKLEHVIIQNNRALKDLAALRNLETSDSITIKANPKLAMLADLQGLKSVTHDLELSSNPSLVNLQGLQALGTVGQNFKLDDNWGLESLHGLDSLSSIGGNLEISYNGRLKNLEGLESLRKVKGYIAVRNNIVLTSLTGIAQIEEVAEGFRISLSDALKKPCSIFKNPTKLYCNF